MLNHSCTFEVERQGGVLILTLQGEIDHHSATQIRTRMDELIWQERPKKTVLDLSAIDFMDSSGLGLIMGRYSLMEKLGGELTLREPNPRIVKIFELAGLFRLVKIEEVGKEKEEGQ